MCTDRSGLICGKMMSNPNWGFMNFDTFGWSLLQVYQISTLEGWADIMHSVMDTYSPFSAFYFIAVVFIGAFFLINLVLAIIKMKFSEQHEKKDQEDDDKKK